MSSISAAGAFGLGNRTVNRMGYGAVQLAATRPQPACRRDECVSRNAVSAAFSVRAAFTATSSPTRKCGAGTTRSSRRVFRFRR
jgi:hypothetical protein